MFAEKKRQSIPNPFFYATTSLMPEILSATQQDEEGSKIYVDHVKFTLL